jgi:hypothetical protein
MTGSYTKDMLWKAKLPDLPSCDFRMLNPLKPSRNYSCMYHLLYQSVIEYSVFMGLG